MMNFDLYSMKEGVCTLLNFNECFFWDIALKSSNVYDWAFFIDMVARGWSKGTVSLPWFCIFIKIISWFGSFDRHKLIKYTQYSCFQLSILLFERSQGSQPVFPQWNLKFTDSISFINLAILLGGLLHLFNSIYSIKNVIPMIFTITFLRPARSQHQSHLRFPCWDP